MSRAASILSVDPAKNDRVYISTAQNLRLWEKARELDSPDDVAAFMSKWGQLSRWIGDKGE
jgi:hypothetical protein